MKYSVLMSVYQKDNPLFFRQAIESIHQQTVQPDEIILVCDGAVTPEHEAVIRDYQSILSVVRLEKNSGLGAALNEGLQYCHNDLIARMDSDDISLPDRCEKELQAFEEDATLGIISGTIEEFYQPEDTQKKKRNLPLTHKEIVLFSKKRCPFNHPAVMYRKSEVLSAGGYSEEYHLFEDYDLWIRMLRNGTVGRNLSDVLLDMRVSDALYMRRGGADYAKALLRFHNHLRKTGWISNYIFATCAVPHALVCILPNAARKKVYQILRKR